MSRRQGGISGIGMKVRRPARDWTVARAKVDGEGVCRACGRGGALEAGHVIGREHDFGPPIRWPSDVKWITRSRVLVAPARIVPLCGDCHRAQHAHALDLLPLLTVEEQAQAVLDAGGIGAAELALLRTHRLNEDGEAVLLAEYDPGEYGSADDDVPF
jgi:hypothetical protein